MSDDELKNLATMLVMRSGASSWSAFDADFVSTDYEVTLAEAERALELISAAVVTVSWDD